MAQIEDNRDNPDDLLIGDNSIVDSRNVVFEGQNLFIDTMDWRKSNLLKIQIIAGFFVFILFGLAEQTLGTLIPVFQKEYHINDVQTSLFFIASVTGYFVMAFLSEVSHTKLGVRGVVIMGTVFMATAYLILSFHPPYLIVILSFVCHGIGLGSIDASLSLWMGFLVDSNEILGILHGCYGIGCMVSPPLITNLLERKVNPWPWTHYYLMLSIIVSTNTVFFIFTYRHETALKFKYSNYVQHADEAVQSIAEGIELLDINGGVGKSDTTNSSNSSVPSTPTVEDNFGIPKLDDDKITATTSDIVKSPVVWLFAFSLFLYVGTEAAFGSWMVTYSTRVLKYSYKNSSYLASSYWSGLTFGRITLGFATSRAFKTELSANFWYFFVAFCGYFIFWLMSIERTVIGLYITAFLTGVFVGPIFPTTIVSSIKMLPKSYHAASVGFICAFGGGGGAALPFIVGLFARTHFYLFPAMIAVFASLSTLLWVFIVKRYGANYNSNRL